MTRQKGRRNPANTPERAVRPLFAALLAGLLLLTEPVHADILGGLFGDNEPLMVQIADPYIELHTGAGRGYPIFHVEERDAWIEILKRKTDWFKVRTEKGKEGWVARDQLEHTLTPAGEELDIPDATLKQFSFHRWEMGAMGGDFDGSDVLTVYGGFFFTPKLSVELSGSEIFDAVSDNEMVDISINIHPFPEWRFSPFFGLGTGFINRNPDPILIQESDTTDQIGHVGAGVRVYLARRFIFRAQYKYYTIFQSSDNNPNTDDEGNREINEWKAGFAVFF